MKMPFGHAKSGDMMFRHFVFSLLALLSIPLLFSEATETPESPNSTFKAKVKVVLVDVVVTDRNNHPITGLQRNNFEIFENGERQPIASFEDHRGESPAPVPPRAPLPAHFYTNAPSVPPTDSINILLLDALNTHSEDQATVRREMISYLKSIDPGPRLAIFTLGSRLQMVEGFSSDPRTLLEALNHKKWGGQPQASTLLRSDAEDTGEQKMLQAMADEHGSNDAIQALQRFLDEVKGTEQVSRTSMTLRALRQLAQYLSGFPGRKNLIWFSGSFPSIVFSSTQDLADDRGLGIEFKKTTNLLAATQIAVYPVAAQGVETQPLFQASQLPPNVVAPPGVPVSQRATQGTNDQLNRESLTRNFNTEAADEIASNTGGKAFYNTNGLKEALAETIALGSHYYSLSYSPNDKKMLGRYRHIQVRMSEGHYILAYRRGYFEEDERHSKSDSPEQAGDPLQRLLLRGLPDSTQITFTLGVLRSNVQPEAATQPAGDNKALRAPLTRFSADFIIPIDSLGFEMTNDGVRHGSLELALVAYDHNGNPLNWLFRSIKTSLKPEVYPAVEKNGAQFHQEIDIPAGENYLRAGIYDLQSDKTGTLEIPPSKVTNVESAATTPEPHMHSTLLPSSGSAGQPAIPVPEQLSAVPDSVAPTAVDRTTSSANEPESDKSLYSPSRPVLSEEVLTRNGSTDIIGYCTALPGTVEYSTVLAKVCEYAFSMRTKLPDLICDEEVKRNWSELETQSYGKAGWAGSLVRHGDVITAKLSYKDGQEYYGDIRVDGKAVDSPRPSGGDWSQGEFASDLFGIFAPSSKTDFRFKKTERLGSRPIAVFELHVREENNRSYFLRRGNQRWFPEYRGALWIDQKTGQIARLQRETVSMPRRPITRAKTKINYANLRLGDGASLVMPTDSEAFACSSPLPDHGEVCSHNFISFKNWHKFAANTTIVLQPLQ